MSFPKRDADPHDQSRDLTPFAAFMEAYERDATVETTPDPPGHGKGGHYYVYDLALMLALVGLLNDVILEPKGYRLTVVEALETDDKVGNGHCLVLVREPCPTPVPEPVPVPPEQPAAEFEEPIEYLPAPPQPGGLPIGVLTAGVPLFRQELQFLPSFLAWLPDQSRLDA